MQRRQESAPVPGTMKSAAAPEVNQSGFCIYIGPNIKGLIQTGTIFRGSRENALRTAAAAIERYPLVKDFSLIRLSPFKEFPPL